MVFQGINEQARAGYYRVELPDYSMLAELTVAPRAAAHRYTSKSRGSLAVDFAQSGLLKQFGSNYYKPVERLLVRIESPTSISARINIADLTLFAHVIFSNTKSNPLLWNGNLDTQSGPVLDLNTPSGGAGILVEDIQDTCEVYVGFSLASPQNAKDNAANAFNTGFDTLCTQAEAAWEKALSRAAIESNDSQLKRIYYTALYHSLIKPTFFGMDGAEHGSWLDFATLWDMYKTQLPLVNSLYDQEAKGICQALLERGERDGIIPISILTSGGADVCKGQARMLGAHVLADAFYRGVEEIDWQRVLDHHEQELRQGDIANCLEGLPSRYTYMLDIAEACNSLSAIAKKRGHTEQANLFALHGRRWSDVFDKKTGLLSTDSNYYEGTNFNYSFRLLHDMTGRIDLAGGPDVFAKLLDDFFGYGAAPVIQQTDPNDKKLMEKGHELHRFEGFNNEPDMETPYAYHYIGRHDRICEINRFGMRSMYHEGRGGLPGNDDSGGLSSCLVWNTLGLFPVSGQDLMLVGSPAVDGARLLLHNGKTFTITVNDQSDENIYVEKVVFNGKTLSRYCLTVEEFMGGGNLEFFMARSPSGG
jgi:predicted alpha-1,2-mannosidase